MHSHVEQYGPTHARDSHEPRKSIVIYSPDRDFCMSLSMLWKDEFDVVTTTDDDMMFNLVQSLQPDVFLAEAMPTMQLQRRFELLKGRVPGLRIVMLCSSRLTTTEIPDSLRQVVDAVYAQPVDIAAFEKCVNSMEWTASHQQ